tara:strand:+ start:183 stop:758 length:576 start_codon:yes stop_codon:yes gene_type:complete
MLKFTYSTVNAGKSANLLMRAYSCSEYKISFQIFVPKVASARDGNNKVISRVGFTQEAISLSDTDSAFEFISQMKDKPQVVFVDEAQFLTKEQVLHFTEIADKMNIPVYAYGLRTDFQGNPFEGSSYMMAWADKIEEIATFSPNGNKATLNQKVNADGSRNEDGGAIEAGFHYAPVTRSEFDLRTHWVRKD